MNPAIEFLIWMIVGSALTVAGMLFAYWMGGKR